ncbi:MAG: hypothetical protein LBL46_00560 [Rickettsiales bacterium]|jgi:hypothetical protein|nr:hypothetical protein [Rickettsiales bacterium]
MKKQISNEQLAMSNGGARQRNSKFLLLIASCSLLIPLAPSAQAAKMCVHSPSYADKDGWASGVGCGGHLTLLSTCSKIYVSGTAGMSGGTACEIGAEYDAIPSSGADTGEYNWHYCKRTFPTESKWICAGSWYQSGPTHVCGAVATKDEAQYTAARTKLLTY